MLAKPPPPPGGASRRADEACRLIPRLRHDAQDSDRPFHFLLFRLHCRGLDSARNILSMQDEPRADDEDGVGQLPLRRVHRVALA